MKVRDLITKLAAYPPDVDIILVAGTLVGEPTITDNHPSRTAVLVPHLHVDGISTEGNAYRRGALEQLFDEVSTGIAPCGATHTEIIEAGGMVVPIEDEVRQAIEGPLSLLLEEATAFVTAALLEDWPDPDGIRSQANDLYWARLDDELRNTPADIPEDVREYTSAWQVFIGLVFERANKAAKAVRGY